MSVEIDRSPSYTSSNVMNGSGGSGLGPSDNELELWRIWMHEEKPQDTTVGIGIDGNGASGSQLGPSDNELELWRIWMHEEKPQDTTVGIGIDGNGASGSQPRHHGCHGGHHHHHHHGQGQGLGLSQAPGQCQGQGHWVWQQQPDCGIVEPPSNGVPPIHIEV